MSSAEKIIPVKLFMGIIYKEESFFEKTKTLLEKSFFEIDFISEVFEFSTPTKYYEKEMGENLNKIFLSFKNLVDPIFLAKAKNISFQLEENLKKNDQRPVNIDPGYIDYNKVVLGSFKYGSHKIYIGENVWADLTLLYSKGTFSTLPWTFPDFKESQRYYKALFKIREKLKLNLQNNNSDFILNGSTYLGD